MKIQSLYPSIKGFFIFGLPLISLLFFNSCKKNTIEKDLKECLLTAQAYNYLGEEERALQLLDSLQLCIHKEYSKKLPKEQIIRLSEIYSRACMEAGRIYREKKDFNAAIENFKRVSPSYLDDLFNSEPPISWDPLIESYIEIVETYKQMGNKEMAQKYIDRVKKILKIN